MLIFLCFYFEGFDSWPEVWADGKLREPGPLHDDDSCSLCRSWTQGGHKGLTLIAFNRFQCSGFVRQGHVLNLYTSGSQPVKLLFRLSILLFPGRRNRWSLSDWDSFIPHECRDSRNQQNLQSWCVLPYILTQQLFIRSTLFDIVKDI